MFGGFGNMRLCLGDVEHLAISQTRHPVNCDVNTWGEPAVGWALVRCFRYTVVLTLPQSYEERKPAGKLGTYLLNVGSEFSLSGITSHLHDQCVMKDKLVKFSTPQFLHV